MKKTSIGGQALMEGLMMIGPENAAIALRKSDGEIIVEKRNLPKKIIWSKIPILRGSVNLFRQMVLGTKALMYSASFIEIEEEESDKESKFDIFLRKVLGQKLYGKLENAFSGNKIPDFMIYFSVIIGILFSIGFYILLPNIITNLVKIDNRILYNLFEAVLRIVLFLGFMSVVSLMDDMKKIWQYHGAEHKTIHCYENGKDLTVENVKTFSTKHPRCGTSFMFLVMIIAILVFSLVPKYDFFVYNALLRLLLIPLVAGISYEILKFAGRRTDWILMKIINTPGLLVQNLTTREPNNEQIEVAIEAFNGVLVDDKEADNW